MSLFVKLSFCIFLFQILTTFAEEPKPSRIISVSGTAVTQIMPDIIVWEIKIGDRDKDIKIAKEKNDAKLNRILALQESLNIHKTDLEISHLSIDKEYERDERGYHTDRFKNFVITRRLIVRQRDLKRFDEFLDKFVSSAEMEISFSLLSSQIYDVRKETRLKALRIAKEKATSMLEVLGAKVGKVLTVNESAPVSWVSQPRQNDNGLTSITMEPGLIVDTTAGTFAPEAIDVRVTVNVTFEIE